MDIGKNGQLIKKGAEANISISTLFGRKVIIKKRLPKKYRDPSLDKLIRETRTIRESQMIHEAKIAGVKTPSIFLIDSKKSMIIMECIEGEQIKDLLRKLSHEKIKSVCIRIGKYLGKLHKHGIIHGDLTTSNMIETAEHKIVFLDFGLSEKSRELESRGVDIHLMRRALQSTHFKVADKCFNYVMEGYAQILEINTVKQILGKMGEIERRGRYVTNRNGPLSNDSYYC